MLAMSGPGCSQRTGSASHNTLDSSSQAALACDYSVLTHHNDIMRSGAQVCEEMLTASYAPYLEQIASRDLGNGEITAQPLLVHGATGVADDKLVVATNGTCDNAGNSTGAPSVFTLDPIKLSGIQTHLESTNHCDRDVPHAEDRSYGVLSTPVIDKINAMAYLVTANWYNGAQEYDLLGYSLQALMTSNGAATPPTRSVKIQGSCSTGNTFSGNAAGQRPALLLDNGYLYLGFAGFHGSNEVGEYNGWIFAYRASDFAMAGKPYCVSRAQISGSFEGMGGIWQYGAGPSADSSHNIYFATGNGLNDTEDDGTAYVKLPSASAWGSSSPSPIKFSDPNSKFLGMNDLDIGSMGPILLPGSGAIATRLLGGGKQGLFRVLDTTNMSRVQSFRAAFHQGGPMLGNPNNLQTGEVSCAASDICNSNHVPARPASGNTNCCKTTCDTDGSCQMQIHGSQPHIHGQPCYLSTTSGGRVLWWGEKDYPRYLNWSTTLGCFVGANNACITQISDTSNRVSSDLTDCAPINSAATSAAAFMMRGMPGALMSLSSNGTSNPVLWANVPQDPGAIDESNNNPREAWLSAFDVSGSFPNKHLARISLGGSQRHAYPTIANGLVYVSSGGEQTGRISAYSAGVFESLAVSSGHIYSTIRHRSGWTQYQQLPVGDPPGSLVNRVEMQKVGGTTTHLIAINGVGQMMYTSRDQAGSWSSWVNASSAMGGPAVASVGMADTWPASADFNCDGAGGPDGHVHQLQLCAVSNGRLYHAIHYCNGAWSTLNDATEAAGAPTNIVAADCAGVEDALHVVVVKSDGKVSYGSRNANFTWTQFVDINQQPSVAATSIAVANVGGAIHAAILVNSGSNNLLHSIRLASGWAAWGIPQQNAQEGGPYTAISVGEVRGELHVVAAGANSVRHTIRHSNYWDAFGDVGATATGLPVASVSSLTATGSPNLGSL